jgi:hypothetical protein
MMRIIKEAFVKTEGCINLQQPEINFSAIVIAQLLSERLGDVEARQSKIKSLFQKLDGESVRIVVQEILGGTQKNTMGKIQRMPSNSTLDSEVKEISKFET